MLQLASPFRTLHPSTAFFTAAEQTFGADAIGYCDLISV